MPAAKELTIKAEYTGTDPNLVPAAHAFARVIREITGTDGTFNDPELETEFQKWREEHEKQVYQLQPRRAGPDDRARRA